MATKSPTSSPPALRSRSLRFSWSALKYVLSSTVAAIVGIMFANPIWSWWSGPSSYKIYVVGDFRSSSGGSVQIRNGFLERGQPAVRIDGVPIEIEMRDDEGDPRLAEAISSEISKSNDALLVVGHFSSTQTKAALPNYLTKANPPIPVVLASETNPYLYGTSGSNSGEEYFLPVLRLPPTDDRQAADAAEFALSRGAAAFWVIEDSENPVYSKYLAGEFIRHVQNRRGSVVFWSSNTPPPSWDTFKALKPNCIFFAGTASNALILIRQIRTYANSASVQMPMIVLSDSAVDRDVLASGGADIDNTYLIYPWLAKEFANGQDGSKVIGRDARLVVDAILDEAIQKHAQLRKQHNWLGYSLRSLVGIHRCQDARATVDSVIRRSMQERTKYLLSSGRQAQFSPQLTNDLAAFHIWKAHAGSFEDVQ